MAVQHPSARGREFSVLRAAAATSASFGVLFIFCWLAAALSALRLPHMFVQLFSAAPVPSAASFGEGLGWSLVAGAASGALVSGFYNAFVFLERR